MRIEKNKLYRYDMLWRLDDYYNPGLTVAAGQHLMDTSRHMQDHNLTLFPQSKVQLRMGYSRNTQDGPALSTIQLFDTSQSNTGSNFPLFTNVRRVQDEFRLGADLELAGFKFTLLHTWVYFREDGSFQENGLTSGDNPSLGVGLTQFQRSAPYHGTSPYWLGNLTKNTKYWAVNGRLTYVGGRGDYVLDEGAFGVTPIGAQNQQVAVGGNAARPSLSGDLAMSVFPGTRLTVVNNTSVDNTRIDGDSAFQQLNDATLTSSAVYFRYLGIRSIANATDLHYRLNDWLSVYGGYHYSTRRIRDLEGYNFIAPSPSITNLAYQQENQQQEGLFGVRIKPIKPMTISLEGDVGRANHPFTPISGRDYQALGGRFDYRVRKLTLNAAYKQNYNNNSITLTSYSSRARNYSAGATWAPHDWLSLDASYTKLHLDTVSGISFFASPSDTSPLAGLNELYISNIHAGNLAAQFVVKKRVNVYLGYSITRDTGDGRSSAAPAGQSGPLSLFVPVQTFPLSYQSPLVRISIRLHPKLRWNVGWQYYNYHEEFGLESFYQGYHANTGYSSLSYSF